MHDPDPVSNQQNGRRNYEVRSGAAANLTNCSMTPILASRPLMQPVRSPMQRLRPSNCDCMPSRRPSTVSSPVFSGSRQRMRWCSSVCFPEPRSRSGTPSASHALHMKRSSKRAALTVISQVKKVIFETDLRKKCSTKMGRKDCLCTCHMLASLSLGLEPVQSLMLLHSWYRPRWCEHPIRLVCHP
jgi:hypothetical protein